MLKYLRGEVYRLLRKRSMYVYFGAIALLYALLVFMRADSLSADGMLTDAASLFGLLPAIIGGYLFAALYTDDLNSKNLSTLIGFGMGKAQIVLSKLILMLLFSGFILCLLPLFMSALYAVLAQAPSPAILRDVYIYALQALLVILAYSALSGVVVYGLQRTTFGMVAYLLLSLGVVGQLLGMLFSWEAVANLLPGLSDHLMSGISTRILFGIFLGESIAQAALEYLIYVGIAIALSVVAFRRKELEF